MKDRRIGKVTVSGLFLHNYIDIVAEIFCKIKAVTIQLDYHIDTDLFEYILYSPFFDACEEGTFAPKYELQITKEQDEKGNLVSFDVKVNKLPYQYQHTHSALMEEKWEYLFGFL
jgi:hypothetical protein